MSTDDRDILEVLRFELDFIEKGGYGRSVRLPWLAKSAFQDSPTCINYAYPEKAHQCTECHLIDFVPGDQRSAQIPCHCIPMGKSGDTIAELEDDENQPQLERELKTWLRARIKEIEASRAQSQGSSKAA